MKHKPFVQDRPSHRPGRFAERVKEELVDLVPSKLKDPRISGVKLLTIVSVTVTPDLKHADVMFSLMGQEPPARIVVIEKGLNKAAVFLRRELSKRLATKVTPHLHFKYDKGFDKSSELSPLYKIIAAKRLNDSEE